MEKNIDYIELVQHAQSGDRECVNRLAEAVRVRLHGYVYRYTLDEDLTQDIVQESILKMLKSFGQIRDAEQFWPWLYKITLNQMRLYHRKEQNRKTVSDPNMDQNHQHNDKQEVIAGLVYDEFREAVFTAMQELKPEHRSIINMRCYDQMSYAEIAKVIDRSEFAAQKLFFRAKKTLKQKLVRHGLGKGSLLMALILFGKLTAPSKAAATSVSVTSAILKVGTLASFTSIAATKTAILSLATAGALTAGAIVATSSLGKDTPQLTIQNLYSSVIPQETQAHEDNPEYWYYYPSRSPDTVIMRVKTTDVKGQNPYCQYLQNSEGNYYYDRHSNTVHIENFRQWQKDFSVWRLPTDTLALTNFLERMDGGRRCIDDVFCVQNGALLEIKQPNRENKGGLKVIQHGNMLGEDCFKYDWPANVKVFDKRDVMHKRGWTYYTVTGQINGQEVTGSGRMPFVYAAEYSHRPWMKLRIGGEVYLDRTLTGFGRPWTGLHTIDTVRRDAAQRQIPFETKLGFDALKAQVLLNQGRGQVIYTINMEQDVVEKIDFTGGRKGQLEFEYLQEIKEIDNIFNLQEEKISSEPKDTLWLIQLIEDALEQ